MYIYGWMDVDEEEGVRMGDDGWECQHQVSKRTSWGRGDERERERENQRWSQDFFLDY